MEDIEELEMRAAEERLKIFHRYQMGRDQKIDIWEDPVFLNYRIDK